MQIFRIKLEAKGNLLEELIVWPALASTRRVQELYAAKNQSDPVR